MDATDHDLPSNRADFSDCDTLDEKLEQNVEQTLYRARQGERFNLSDLMADAEQLHREVDEADADPVQQFTEAVEPADDVDTATLLEPVVVADGDDGGAAQ